MILSSLYNAKLLQRVMVRLTCEKVMVWVTFDIDLTSEVFSWLTDLILKLIMRELIFFATELPLKLQSVVHFYATVVNTYLSSRPPNGQCKRKFVDKLKSKKEKSHKVE